MIHHETNVVLPSFLTHIFEFRDYHILDIKCLYVGLRHLMGGKTIYVSIQETPHFMFAQHIINGAPSLPIHGYRDYAHYISLHPQSCTEDKFLELIESIRLNGYDFERRPILVFRHWRRPWPLNRWDVADGFHKLAILAALGESSVKVGTLRPKRNIFQRIVTRLCNML